MRRVSWFSCGAASAVATKLSQPDVVAYCETGAEDGDNARFMRECESWFGASIMALKNSRFDDTWDVWRKREYLSGVAGAPCTGELKVKPRLEFQQPDDVHIFGYTADASDVKRANMLRENWPELKIETPLIDKGLTKANCLALVQQAGIQPPRVYAMGFPNANCIPCVKATSPSYWALIRQCFPAEFSRMVKMSRELNVRLTRIEGKRVFIDEIPAGWPTTEPLAPECDFLCSVATEDILHEPAKQTGGITPNKKPFAWSWSKLNAFETCPRQYQETKETKRIKEFEGSGLLVGNAAHSSLELYATKQTPIPPTIQCTDAKGGTTSMGTQGWAPVADRIVGLKGELIVEKQLCLNEQLQPVSWFAKDAWVRGIVDIGKINDTKALAFDWKTGKRKPDNDQLKLFAGLMFASYPQLEEVRTGFIWLKEGCAMDTAVYERKDVPGIWATFEPRVAAMKRAYTSGDYPCKPSGLCRGWCPVADCEHWEEKR